MKDNNPLVSIITPCYNVEKYISEFLDSILNQTYTNLELILINDGSTDNTEEVIMKYKQVFEDRNVEFIYITHNNSGQAAAINRGLKIFKGKYLIWPDADDVLHKDSIKIRVDFLESHSNYHFVRSNGTNFVDNFIIKDRISVDNSRFSEDIFYNLFLEKTFNSSGCYMMSRDLFLKSYPERQIYAGVGSQNWQLLVPAASRSKCAIIDKDLYFVRIRSDSFCRIERDFNEWIIRYDDHKNLLIDAFHHSDCDVKSCVKLIEERYIRKKIELAIKFNNTRYLEEMYKELESNSFIRKRDLFVLLAARYTIVFKMQKIIWFLNKAFNKLKRETIKVIKSKYVTNGGI